MTPAEIRMVSIDPGDVHNGVALWLGASCYQVMEVRKQEIYTLVEIWLADRAMDEVVIEDYRLYPDKAAVQSYSPMITVKRVGIIQYLCDRAGVPCILQGASIKEPAFKIAAGRNIEVLGSNQHMRDAWVHGYYRISHR